MQLTEALGMAYARGHDDVVLGQASGPPPAKPLPGGGNVVPFSPARVRETA